MLYRKTLWRVTDSGQTWTLRASIEIGGGSDDDFFSAMYWSGARDGWLVSDQILRTTDGGNSWASVLRLPDSEGLDGIWVHGSKGWAVGGRFTPQFSMDPALLQTTDGGATWKPAALNTEGLDRTAGLELYCVYFLDAQSGWISGTTAVWRTDDGGATWKLLPITIGELHGARFTQLQFCDPLHGFAHYGPPKGAVPHELVHSTDGGRSWRVVDPPFRDHTTGLFDLQFFSESAGYILFQGQLYKTNDAGRNWRRFGLDPNYADLIYFLDENHGYAAGKDGALARTDDGGATWRYPRKTQ